MNADARRHPSAPTGIRKGILNLTGARVLMLIAEKMNEFYGAFGVATVELDSRSCMQRRQ